MESADEGKKLSPPSTSTLSTSSDSNHAAAATESPESTTAPRKRDEDNVIGTLEPGLNQTIPGVKPAGDGRSSGSDSRTNAATTLGEVDSTGKGSSGPSSSSVPEHPSQSNGSTTGNDLRAESTTTVGQANRVSTTGDNLGPSVSDGAEALELGATGPKKPVVDSQVASDYTDEDLLASLLPKDEQPTSLGLEAHALSQPAVDGLGELNLENDSAATQSPPTQVMERPGDPTSSPSYRIPDYVFARNKSTAPMEWSTASNESLFSIQMGNMSFTRDQFPWLGKSGELGLPGEVYMPSSSTHNIDFTSNQPPSKQTIEVPQKSSGNSDEEPSPRVTEANAAETMREVLRENAENHDKSNAQNYEKHADGKYHSSCLSHASDGSTRSFAFPILDGNPSCSLRGDAKHKHYSPSKPRSQRESRPQTPKETPNASQTPKSNPNIAKCGWGLSCFSCCPSCCS